MSDKPKKRPWVRWAGTPVKIKEGHMIRTVAIHDWVRLNEAGQIVEWRHGARARPEE